MPREAMREAPREKAGISLRLAGGTDTGRIRELRSVVGWSADPRAFDLLRGMRDARWTVAEVRDGGISRGPSGGLVGMIGAVPFGTNPFGGVGIICHLAVHDGYRGLGIGARLTSWAVAYLRSRGVALMRLHSTPQAAGIYRSAGFVSTTARTVYRLEDVAPKPRVYGGRHDVETLTTGDLPEVYGLDLWSYGADRSALILATLRLHPGRSLVARDSSGRIKGYLVRSSTPRAVRIGPFLAENLDVARLLVGRALENCVVPVEVTVTTPEGTAAHRLFEELGFVGREDRMQMELGEMPAAYQEGLEHYGTTPYLAT